MEGLGSLLLIAALFHVTMRCGAHLVHGTRRWPRRARRA